MATWIPVVVAILSALLSGYFAQRARAAEFQAQRLIELERRLAVAKGEVFEPLIEALGSLWDQSAKGAVSQKWAQQHVLPALTRFGQWVQVYGADESVRAYHRFMQAIYAGAPANVMVRLLAELILMARRELGHPDTTLDAVDVMGIRINDIYAQGTAPAWARLPLAELYKSERWAPPWGSRFDAR